ncbi:MAG: hypothetical protein A3F11_10675 [Gammaproteobacteria bacterium RIFCSPHIGHO2_12_FULL_37_14]|nr:MAG: hypothetical protein A3F11_10675 [Gammaproteobacteria bacterium RIFCSPHIGHO2_12_FULL_37_14]
MQTRLPNSDILIAYLDLHPQYRAIDRSSTIEYFKTKKELVTSLFTGELPVVQQLDKIIDDIKAEIRTANAFVDWFKLIFKLRGKADEAQSLKTKSDEPSILSETLHGVAGIIICALEENKDWYDEIDKLQKSKVDQIKYIDYCIKERQGKGVADANTELFKTTRQLALLGDIVSCNEAMQFNLLSIFKVPTPTQIEAFKCVDTANHAAPLELQKKFGEWFYGRTFQPLTKISFNEFKEEAKEMMKEKQLENEPSTAVTQVSNTT